MVENVWAEDDWRSGPYGIDPHQVQAAAFEASNALPLPSVSRVFSYRPDKRNITNTLAALAPDLTVLRQASIS
jgi:hypothetical protein